MCHTVNESTNRFCYNCQTLLQRVESHKNSNNDPIYYFQQVRDRNVVAMFGSEKQNLFNIVRPNPALRFSILMLTMFLGIFLLVPVLFVPTYGIIVFGILYLIILYICIYFISKIIYYNVYSNKTLFIGKIKLKPNFFNIVPQLKRRDWILTDDSGAELSVTKFIAKYTGFIRTNTDILDIKPSHDMNNNYQGISEFQAINKIGSEQISITTSYDKETIDRNYTKISGNYEITASPDIDVRIVMFFTYIIFMKLLKIT